MYAKKRLAAVHHLCRPLMQHDVNGICKASNIGLAVISIRGASIVACSKLREEDQLVLGLDYTARENLVSDGAAPQLLNVWRPPLEVIMSNV